MGTSAWLSEVQVLFPFPEWINMMYSGCCSTIRPKFMCCYLPPHPCPEKKKFKVNRLALFVAKENRDSTGTHLCFKQYKDVWVTLVGLYFPLLRNPIGRTVLNLNFQHLFTLFHSDSVVVSLACLLSFFWSHLDMLSPTTALHGITA